MILASCLLWAAPALAATLQAETMRLEALDRSGHVDASGRSRLAQIYYMTSRCEDARRVLEKGSGRGFSDAEIECACGGSCETQAAFAKAERLRARLAGGASWRSAPIEALWRDVRRYPEAQYVMFRHLSSGVAASRGPEAGALRVELESLLRSLEVRK